LALGEETPMWLFVCLVFVCLVFVCHV
jgi:hypothetical protein